MFRIAPPHAAALPARRRMIILAALLAAAAGVSGTALRRASAQPPPPALQFSSAAYAVAKGMNNSVTVTVTRAGDTSGASSVDYATLDGTATQRRDYTVMLGTLRFAAGETAKSFDVPVNTDACACGDQTFTVALSNPAGAALGAQRTASVTITDPSTQNTANPIATPQVLVSQHYHDFLGRAADAPGLAFWTNAVSDCDAKPTAEERESCRDNVSAAFFLSIEFQEAGSYVIRAQHAAFGRNPSDTTRLSFLQFIRDQRQISEGVVIGQPGATERLEQNKLSYLNRVVADPDFTARYPLALTAAQYADALFASAGVTPTVSERQAAIDAYGPGGAAGRAAALKSVVEANTFLSAELNRAFILLGYFGYFRANPSDIPGGEADFQSRLQALNAANGNYSSAGTVRGFRTSPLYVERFGATPSTTPVSVNTQTGSGVTAQGGGIVVRFSGVSAGGTTTFTPANPAGAGALPAGLQLADGAPAFDVATTAAFTAPVEVCFDNVGVTDPEEFARLRVLHGSGGALVNRTTRLDFAARTICARVSALGAFVLAQLAPPSAPTVNLASGAHLAGEFEPSVFFTVTRAGDISGAATVTFRTVDDPAAVPCDPTITQPNGQPYPQGAAYARCDYATTIDTISFAPGEAIKQIAIPVVNDAHVEGAETFQIAISSPSAGTSLGAQSDATVTIADNDAGTPPNPIRQGDAAGIAFFVRQHYLDFLNREPEPGEPWSAVLAGCPDQFDTSAAGPSANCNRVHVSAAFVGSEEFRLKGFYVFNFYRAAFGRLPTYEEIVVDMRSVTGQTAAEVYAKKAAFATAFAQRAEFATAFPGTMTGQQYVDALMNHYSLQSIRTNNPATPDDGSSKVTLTRAELVGALNGGALTRAQVLRAVADSDEVAAAEFNRAFVAMQYFGYLRRTPEQGGFNDWLDHLSRNPGDFRGVVGGFLNSQEYVRRFGRP